jgi:kynurenine formamidase
MYNGIPAELVTAERGATALSVLAARGGIVTRGVLIDVARDRGVPSLPPGEGVGPEELEAFEHRHGLRILPGDAVLLRTGYGAQRRISGPSRLDQGWAGWHPSTLPWLHERDVALVGSDTFNEALPNGYKDVTLPLHTVGIIGMGLWLLDNCDLEAAGATAEQLGRSEFLFCLAPLAIEGGTGSPANPLAVF